MFKAPTNPVQLEKWRRAITGADRALTSDDYVCRLHFAAECIEHSYDDNFVGDSDRPDPGCPKLIEGAVPEIFPDSPSASKRNTSDRRTCIPQKVPKLVLGDIMSANDDFSRQNLFSELRESAESLCPESWRSLCNDEYVCFVKLQIVCGQARSTMSVSISKDLSVQVFHGGVPVSVSFPDRVRTRDDVKTMLQRLANSQFFIGNPSERLTGTRSADPVPADDHSELDLSTICNLDTSVTDMLAYLRSLSLLCMLIGYHRSLIFCLRQEVLLQ